MDNKAPATTHLQDGLEQLLGQGVLKGATAGAGDGCTHRARGRRILRNKCCGTS